jgi:hypothetical protein
MRFSKIPFVSSGNLMDGLAPIVSQSPAQKTMRKKRLRPGRMLSGYGPMYPNSSMLGAYNSISESKFFGEESASNYNGIQNQTDPLFRNSDRVPYTLDGLGDALPPGQSTTVMLRPNPGSPAGFPGFFAWLKSEQPDMWNYAKVALPAYTTQAEGLRTGGATLSGLGHSTLSRFFGEESANNDNGIVNDTDSMFRNWETKPFAMGGLGDDSDSIDLSTLSPVATDVTAITSPLSTVSVDNTNAETSDVNTPPNPGPGAVAQIVSTLTAAAPSILNTVNQQTLFNTQLARAQAGLPPLNTSAYGLPSSLTSLASGGALPLLLIGGAAVVFMMLSRK